MYQCATCASCTKYNKPFFGRSVGVSQIFFQEICSSGGKQKIHKVSAAFIVKNRHPQTSLKHKIQKISLIIDLYLKPNRATDSTDHQSSRTLDSMSSRGTDTLPWTWVIDLQISGNISVVELGNRCIFLSKTCKFCLTTLCWKHINHADLN